MDASRKPSGHLFADTRESWPLMTVYERFEQIVALVLGAIIALVSSGGASAATSR